MDEAANSFLTAKQLRHSVRQSQIPGFSQVLCPLLGFLNQ